MGFFLQTSSANPGNDKIRLEATSIWRFPKMGVPPNHPFWISIVNHPFWGTPIYGNRHLVISQANVRGLRQRCGFKP